MKFEIHILLRQILYTQTSSITQHSIQHGYMMQVGLV